jgi:hypothetical protein
MYLNNVYSIFTFVILWYQFTYIYIKQMNMPLLLDLDMKFIINIYFFLYMVLNFYY